MTTNTKSHEFVVSEMSSARVRSEYDVVLGVDVKISSRQLREFLLRPLFPEDLDLLYLAGVVARVDRLVPRTLSQGWGRKFHIQMCVHDPERWSRPNAASALKESLGLLTGDDWSFEFKARSTDMQYTQLPLFRRKIGRVAAMAYSGGLDSYCGLSLWEPASDETLLLVHTRHSASLGPLVKETLHGHSHHRVTVPVELPNLGNHPEPSYRTRTFLFLVAAAVATRLGQGDRILITENGQGALGPALVRLPGEHPYYSTHPVFTRRLADMLSKVWDGAWSVRFEHPAVNNTKGEILRQASEAGVIPRWAKTRSCSRTPARHHRRGAPSQCGICGGCLLRRVSLSTAGLVPFNTSSGEYLWSRLDVVRLEDACSPDYTTHEGDRKLAVQNVIDMASLADFASASQQNPTLLALIEDLAYGLGISEVDAEQRVRRLVRAHKTEWETALEQIPRSSWLRRIAEERL